MACTIKFSQMFVHLTHAAISLALSIAADVTQLGGVAAQSLSEPHYSSVAVIVRPGLISSASSVAVIDRPGLIASVSSVAVFDKPGLIVVRFGVMICSVYV